MVKFGPVKHGVARLGIIWFRAVWSGDVPWSAVKRGMLRIRQILLTIYNEESHHGFRPSNQEERKWS